MADQVEELLDKVPLYPAPPHGSRESSFGQTASQGSCSSNLDAEFINASSEIYNQHFRQTTYDQSIPKIPPLGNLILVNQSNIRKS